MGGIPGSLEDMPWVQGAHFIYRSQVVWEVSQHCTLDSRCPSQLDRSGLRLAWPLLILPACHIPQCETAAQAEPWAQLSPHVLEYPQGLHALHLMARALVPECTSHCIVGGGTAWGQSWKTTASGGPSWLGASICIPKQPPIPPSPAFSTL